MCGSSDLPRLTMMTMTTTTIIFIDWSRGWIAGYSWIGNGIGWLVGYRWGELSALVSQHLLTSSLLLFSDVLLDGHRRNLQSAGNRQCSQIALGFDSAPSVTVLRLFGKSPSCLALQGICCFLYSDVYSYFILLNCWILLASYCAESANLKLVEGKERRRSKWRAMWPFITCRQPSRQQQQFKLPSRTSSSVDYT
jgi:hypothetical protein